MRVPAEWRRLLDEGADPNSRRVNGDQPLHWAADGEPVGVLFAGGADLEGEDVFGGTPLAASRSLASTGQSGLSMLALAASVAGRCFEWHAPDRLVTEWLERAASAPRSRIALPLRVRLLGCQPNRQPPCQPKSAA